MRVAALVALTASPAKRSINVHIVSSFICIAGQPINANSKWKSKCCKQSMDYMWGNLTYQLVDRVRLRQAS